ncbi:pirin family protein [Taibaiella koreensis]|uniref:pirin family protein n=1 Tax=Taibaiella koreensis TaxID=1268548 RepID=UPI000E59CF3E|nr:pirin family protein [Taibaiella koreensis]
MSNINLIIEERPRNIGNFMVGRLLPFKDKRMVGPFIFIDHMGPVSMSERENMDIPPHPHIGLSTLTYLFEGAIMHRDSLGTEVEIKPGQVNWMTAGAGIVHSERTPEYLRHADKVLHGLQIWVALPKDHEDMACSFFHADEEDLPQWTEGDIRYRLIAGSYGGKTTPVPVYSPLYLLEIKSDTEQTLQLGSQLYGEAGLYILEGSVTGEGHVFEPRQLLVAKDAKLCTFTMAPGTTVYIFGGEPLPEDRLIYWNFVATDHEHINNAKEKWKAQAFEPVPGETDFVPLPPEPSNLKMK